MQIVTISHISDTNQRLDRFCKKYLPNAALGGIYKMLRTGKIKVNGKKKDQTYKLELGDEITFWVSDDEIGAMQLKREDGRVASMDTQKSSSYQELSILYEDDYLMVINKPAGINVHAGDHKTSESNLINQVQDYLKGKHDSLTFRPALVHRIDRDTSGCIIIAKEKRTLELLLDMLQSHNIQKIYHACVFGIPSPPQDTIRKKILRIENARDETKVRVDDAGQNAITHYCFIKSQKIVGGNAFLFSGTQRTSKITSISQSPSVTLSDGLSFSLLECRIETGRTHQIRVHLAYIGYPIIGDKIYGDKKLNAFIARNNGISRQMLHARALVFAHPITSKIIRIEAPYPEDFQSLLSL